MVVALFSNPLSLGKCLYEGAKMQSEVVVLAYRQVFQPPLVFNSDALWRDKGLVLCAATET
jgi:hypothetical protein